jgi:hypothetical protein
VTELERRLRGLASKATPGPWAWTPEIDINGDCGPNLVSVGGRAVLKAWGHDAWGIRISQEDAALVVGLVNSLPEILAALKGDE